MPGIHVLHFLEELGIFAALFLLVDVGRNKGLVEKMHDLLRVAMARERKQAAEREWRRSRNPILAPQRGPRLHDGCVERVGMHHPFAQPVVRPGVADVQRRGKLEVDDVKIMFHVRRVSGSGTLRRFCLFPLFSPISLARNPGCRCRPGNRSGAGPSPNSAKP